MKETTESEYWDRLPKGRRFLSVSELYGPEWQRKTQTARAKRIARNFTPEVFGNLLVATGPDGRHYVIDGLHRLGAAVILGLTKVPCVVISADEQKMARLFAIANGSAYTKPVSPKENLTAQIVAKDEAAVHVRDACETYGIPVGANAATMRQLVDQHGAQALFTTLRVMRNGEAPHVYAWVLKGLGLIVAKRHPVDEPRLAGVIHDKWVNIIARYNADGGLGTSGPHASGPRAANAILFFYNKKLSTRRLEIF